MGRDESCAIATQTHINDSSLSPMTFVIRYDKRCFFRPRTTHRWRSHFEHGLVVIPSNECVCAFDRPIHVVECVFEESGVFRIGSRWLAESVVDLCGVRTGALQSEC